MTKEELIKEIETKTRILYEKLSLEDLEKALKEVEKAVNKVESIEKVIKKIGD